MSKRNFKILQFTVFGLLLLFQVRVNGQTTIPLTGRVLSYSGIPVRNASVSIEGSAIDPAITDSAGYFSIEAPDGRIWLLVNPVDTYKPKRLFLNSRTSLEIFLVPLGTESGYDEVNLLYGSETRRNIKGSVFHTEQLNQAYQHLTIGQDLQGKVPGMWVVNNSGMPGSGTFHNLRGLSGLFTNQQALYIIDGIMYENAGTMNSIIDGFSVNRLSGIDPEDIVSISVLKDAGFTSLYGTKAGKGIIKVETLKPSESLTKINVSAYGGFTASPVQLPVLNSSNFRTLAQDLLQTSGKMEEQFRELYPGLYDDPFSKTYYRYNHETNWQNEVFRNAITNGLHASVRGGDEIGKYGLSVGFSRAQGIMKSTDYNRFSIRFVGDVNIFTWLKMYVATNLNYTSSQLQEAGVSESTSPVLTSLFKPPFMAPYQYSTTGQKLLYFDDVDVFGVSNPAAIINTIDAVNNAYRFIGSFRFVGNITNHLKWNSVIGLNFNTMKENIFLPDKGMTNYLMEEAYNLSKHKSDYLYSLQFDNNLSYVKSIAGNGKLSMVAGMRLYTNHLETDIGISANTPSDEYTSLRYGAAGLRYVMGNLGNWSWLSYYANADYSMFDRYYAGISVSADGSSRTGKDADLPLSLFDRPFGVFPSLNLAWRASDEAFLKNIKWLEELKFRFSTGLSGNDDIGNYTARQYYQQILYRETSGMIIGSLPNTSLHHEVYLMNNFGADLSLFGERLILSADIYTGKTHDLFILEDLEGYLGYDLIPSNNGELSNKGMEWMVQTRLVNSNRFKWDIQANLAFNRNEVVSIEGGQLVTGFPGGQLVTRPGNPVNSFYGYIAEGVFSTTEEALQANLVNEIGFRYEAGDIRFRDISGPSGNPDGIINEFDKTIIGNPNPDYFGGVNNSFQYKRWSLDIFLQFVSGNEVFNYLRSQTEKMTDLDNQSVSVLRRWQYEGQDTDIPRAYWGDLPGNTSFSTRWIEDGSYLRIKNLTLAYTVPNRFLVFQNARIYLSVNNLYTFTKYLGYDPEFNYSSEPYLIGIDYGTYPIGQSYMAGIKFGL